MPKPDASTPISQLVAVGESMASWYDAHAERLSLFLGPDYDGAVRLTDAARRLRVAHAHYVDERQDDVTISRELKQIYGRTQTIVRAGTKLAMLVFREDERAHIVLREFSSIVPTDIDTIPEVRVALGNLKAALTKYAPQLDQGVERTPRFLSVIEEIMDSLDALHEIAPKERAETHAARAEREEARGALLGLINEVSLSAEILIMDDPVIYDELLQLFVEASPG